MRRGARSACLFACLVLAFSACSTTSTLSAVEALEDLDAIVTLQETGGVRSLRYADVANRSAWYLRQPLFVPFRWLLKLTLPRHEREVLAHPSASVRELLRTLPQQTGRDLLLSAAAATRYAWLAELDQNPQTRMLAIDGLATICRRLRIEVFAGAVEDLYQPLAADRLNLALSGLRAASPEARGDRDVSDAELEPYRSALQTVSSRPLEDWAMRIILVDDLSQLHRTERDARARPWVDAALRVAIGHCVRGLLLHTVQERTPQFAEVRLRAMQRVRTLGGPATVPLLLAAMVASPAERARGTSPFDPDPLVQLRLIHYCGQLDSELGNTVVRLPGRDDWDVASPAEFLARTVLNEQSYFSQLRTPAIVALTWCLGRASVDPDPAWVREWLDTRRS